MQRDDTYTITETDQADPEARQEVLTQLRAFNRSRSAQHRALDAAGPQPLELYVRDADGTLLGALIGSTYWGWLEIDKLWLDERLRGQGYGRRLMAQAEATAIRRGCQRAYVTTFSFQAPGFYERLGYVVVGRLDDYPPGAAFYGLRKALAAPDDHQPTGAI